jgi:ankyrin repeat protein
LCQLTSLDELDLSSNQIGDSGAEALAESLRKLAHLSALSLAHNQIGDAGAKAIADCLGTYKSVYKCDRVHTKRGEPKLIRIHLEYNQIGDAGAEALRPCRDELRQIYCEDGNQIGWNEERKRYEAQKARLFEALKNADLQVVEEILAIPDAPTITEALFMACGSSKIGVKTVRWLVENGAVINARGRLRRTPLHEVFLSYGEDDYGEDDVSKTKPGNEGALEKMRLLIGLGADLTAVEENGLTPLAWARYVRKPTAVALLSGISVRTAWEEAHPIETSYETMSKQLVSEHGPLERVEYVSHWPKFEIKFHYKDGACVYSGPRTAKHDINFLSLGYVGQGPRYAKHFLKAAGFNLTYDEIAGIKEGDNIVLSNGKAIVNKVQ